jgi:hypothetical protein
VAIAEYSDFAEQHGAWAVTRVNNIYLRGSGEAFLADLKLAVHEYFHVLRQWNTGELTVPRYVAEWVRQGFSYDKTKYEVQAREFADQNVQRYRSLMEQKR